MYENIKCPKCGKRYFKVKTRSNCFDVFDAFSGAFPIFKPIEDPIYKEGVLQNPPELTPTVERFLCMDCNCNFRVEAFQTDFLDSIPKIIDEDAEKRELLKRDRQKTENAYEKPLQENLNSVVTSSPIAINTSESSLATTEQYATVREVQELREKVDKLMEKCFGYVEVE